MEHFHGFFPTIPGPSSVAPHLGVFVVLLAFLALLALAWRHGTSPLAQLHGAERTTETQRSQNATGIYDLSDL